MTSLSGSSRQLSNPEDRRQFHALRKRASAIAIGGSTFRSEPYTRTPLPLFVSTKSLPLSNEATEDQQSIRFFNLSPLKLIETARGEIDGDLLVEGGVNFLHDLIQAQVVDQMFITRVDVDGDAFEFDEDHLNLHYRLVSSEVINTSTFETWEPIGLERRLDKNLADRD